VIRVFGLTGGIGSGKTTVGRRFEERGVGVVDADELSREVVRAGSEGLAAIRERFGDRVIGSDGTLDRAGLARVVFGDEGAKAALEAITHPRIRTLARERFAALEQEGALLGCYVVPLLYERGLESEYSPVVVVNATPEQQRERARLRDAAPEEAIEARMRAQLPLSDKVERADFVIDNTGAIEDALDQADQVLDAICLEFGLDPARFPRSREAELRLKMSE
jgi:dephospho-CoA kinase